MSSIDQVKENFKSMKTGFKEKLKKMKEEVAKEAEAMFKEGCKVIFEQFPDLNSFSWTQYTVYFNDGDTCYFSAHTDSYSIMIDEEEHCEEAYENVYVLKQDIKKHENNPVIRAELEKQLAVAEEAEKKSSEMKNVIGDVLSVFDSDDFLEMFGDHARVYVTRDGIEVEEYTDHD